MLSIMYTAINKDDDVEYEEIFGFVGLSYNIDTSESVLLLSGTRPRFCETTKAQHKALVASIKEELRRETKVLQIEGKWRTSKGAAC